MRERRKALLFVLGNSNIGGPQKSLVALLERLDPAIIEASVCVLDPGGELEPLIAECAKLIPADDLIMAAAIPSRRPVWALWTILKHRRLGMFLAVVAAVARHLVFRSNMNQERQRIWQRYSPRLPLLQGSYDLAFGILGLSTYCVVDCVDATRRFHWVRSDTRILQRNVEIDAAYYRELDGALAVSSECAHIFEEMYEFMRGRVRVLHNHIPRRLYERLPADVGLMTPEPGRTKVLTVCRLDPLKGIEMAIEACAILIDRQMPVEWYVLGDGVFRGDVERDIANRGIGEHFKLLGFQLNTMAFIEACDVFVHPSRSEGKANAVDEARFAGKPIVVTNYATVADQIAHDVTGLVCDMNAESIAGAVERLMKDNVLAQRLGEACRGSADGIDDPTDFFLRL